jgi:hypothetical protein
VAAAETTSASPTPVFKRSVERLECLAPLQSGNKSWNVTTEPSSFLCSRQMVERGDQTAPLQTKAHLELAALSEKYIKIQDDLKALQSSKAVSEEARATAEYELEQFRHQHAPVSWQQQPAAVQIDLGSDPNGDACVEALVAQAQLSMRAVVELARQSQQHKQAADSLWNEMQQSSRREQHAQQWASPVSGYYEGANFNQHAPRQQQQQHYPPPFHNGPRQRSSFNR